MEMRSRVLGQEHPDTLTSMANLAYIYKNLDHTDDAINLIERAVELMLKTTGPDYLNTIALMDSLKS
jgi:Tetratricopeptide repeat